MYQARNTNKSKSIVHKLSIITSWCTLKGMGKGALQKNKVDALLLISGAHSNPSNKPFQTEQ